MFGDRSRAPRDRTDASISRARTFAARNWPPTTHWCRTLRLPPSPSTS